MKKQATIITMALMLCTMLGTLALAKNKTHIITFTEDTLVNGTVVKKGEYQAEFDEQSGEFSILHGKHVIATAKAKEEMLNKKAAATTYDEKTSDNGPVLTQVTFSGDHYAIVLNDSGNQASEGQ